MISTPLERKIKKEEQENKEKTALRKMKLDFNTVAATPEGMDVFKHIMNRCSYQKPTITFNPETREVNTISTIYLEARRDLYLELRAYISENLLKKIEY